MRRYLDVVGFNKLTADQRVQLLGWLAVNDIDHKQVFRISEDAMNYRVHVYLLNVKGQRFMDGDHVASKVITLYKPHTAVLPLKLEDTPA